MHMMDRKPVGKALAWDGLAAAAIAYYQRVVGRLLESRRHLDYDTWKATDSYGVTHKPSLLVHTVADNVYSQVTTFRYALTSAVSWNAVTYEDDVHHTFLVPSTSL